MVGRVDKGYLFVKVCPLDEGDITIPKIGYRDISSSIETWDLAWKVNIAIPKEDIAIPLKGLHDTIGGITISRVGYRKTLTPGVVLARFWSPTRPYITQIHVRPPNGTID